MSDTKFLDLKVGDAYFAPNPHADFITIHAGGEEVTLRGVDFWQYVGECRKRQRIKDTVEWLEQQPVTAYIPSEFRPESLDY